MPKSHFKAIAVALSVMTVMSLAAGCQKKEVNSVNSDLANSNVTEKDGYFYSNEPITISVMFSDNSGYPMKDSWKNDTNSFLKTLTEKTNVTLDLNVVPMSDYNSKRSVLIASGQQPMVIPKTYPGQEDTYVTSGQVLPISDYVKYMPVFSQQIKDWKLEDDLKTITQGDGKYYIMPGLHQSYIQDYSLCVRKDIFDKEKIALPESWDELYAALKKLKTAYPDITPFSDRWQFGETMQLAGNGFVKTPTGLKGTDADWSPANLLLFDSSKKSFSFYPTSSAYKDELTYFNKLVNEGLVDKESMTQTSDQAINKFGTGKSFVIAANSQSLANDYKPKLDVSLGKGNYELAKINVPAGPAGKYLVGNRLENGVMISSKVKDNANWKTIVQFVDWLWNSEKAQELAKWGIQDVTFTKTGDKYALKDGYTLPAYGLNSTATNAIDMRKQLGYGCGVFILSYGGPDVLAHSYMSDADITWSANVAKTRTLLPAAPKVAYDEIATESQNMTNTALKDYNNSMSYKFILGQSSLSSDWDTFVKTMKDKGSETYTKTANDTYAKQK